MLQRRSIAGRVALGCALVVGIGGAGVAFFVAGRTPNFGVAFANVALLVLTVALAVAATVRWLLGRELRTLPQLAAAIDGAELDGSPLYRNLPDRGPVEIEHIVAAWNGFALRFDILMHSVRDKATTLNAGTVMLGTAGPETERRAREAAAALEQITSQVRSAAVDRGATQRLAQGAADAAQALERHVAEARAGLRHVHGALQELAAAGSRTQAALHSIQDGALHADVLALNGAIEAARLGDGGRGFAAIAAEVRSLAQQGDETARSHRALLGRSLDVAARGADHMHALQQSLSLAATGLHRLLQHTAELQQRANSEAGAVEAACSRGDELMASAVTAAAQAAELAATAARVSEAAAAVEATVWPPPEVDDRDIVEVGEASEPVL